MLALVVSIPCGVCVCVCVCVQRFDNLIKNIRFVTTLIVCASSNCSLFTYFVVVVVYRHRPHHRLLQ